MVLKFYKLSLEGRFLLLEDFELSIRCSNFVALKAGLTENGGNLSTVLIENCFRNCLNPKI